MQVSKILIIVFHELCFALLIILPMDFTERVNASPPLWSNSFSYDKSIDAYTDNSQ